MKKFLVILLIIILFVVINGGILYYAIQVPEIKLIEKTDPKDTNLEFEVNCKLGTDVNVSLDGVDVPYKNSGNKYIIDSKINGTLKIVAKASNGIETVYNYTISQHDDTLPVIDENSVSITAGILSLNVSDTQTGINYDTIYAVDATNKQITPVYVNKDIGIIQFKMDTDSLTVHIEDLAGNALETTYRSKQAD